MGVTNYPQCKAICYCAGSNGTRKVSVIGSSGVSTLQRVLSVLKPMEIPYSLKFSRIKYFAVWLNSAQKQIFTDKIFVVERARELCKATLGTQLLARTTITLDSGPVGN